MKSSMIKVAAFLSLMFFADVKIQAQAPPQSIADSLQSILNHALNNGFTNPGVIMTVTAPGAWTWSGYAGDAISGQTTGQPYAAANSTMKFRAGSITKNMVAACILKMEQQGLLSVNDAINKYLRATLITDTINPSDTVRIRHLLNHTSGIANSGDNVSCQMNVLSNLSGSHSLEEAVYCGASQGELFPPAFAWGYSNTNYSILAMIIEKISGQTYSTYVTQNIIQPLNLQNTEIPSTNQISSAHMGCYWNLGSNPWTDLTVINPTTYTGWADVVSTTQDLITYYSALRSGLVINATELAVMNTIDPASMDYGMGLDFYYFSGKTYSGHYGEVANTSGMFFADINSNLAPNGYYITYNFNTQGSDMINLIDLPVFNLLNNPLASIEEKELISFNLFPNPAKDYFKVHYASGVFSDLYVTDIQGREVFHTVINSSSTDMQIDVHAFEKGLYMIKMAGGSQSVIKKLLVE